MNTLNVIQLALKLKLKLKAKRMVYFTYGNAIDKRSGTLVCGKLG